MELFTSEKIRVICKRQNITVAELADKCGWSRPNLANKLRRDNFCESDLRKIADALGCELIIDFVESEKGNTDQE